MAKNERLQEVILEELYEFLKTDKPKKFDKLNSSERVELLSEELKVEFDEKARYALRFDNILIKGHDLRGCYEEEPANKTFMRSIRNAAYYSGKNSFPTFIFAALRGQFGFYIAREANGKKE